MFLYIEGNIKKKQGKVRVKVRDEGDEEDKEDEEDEDRRSV